MMQSAAAVTPDSSDPSVSAPRDPLLVAWGRYLRSSRNQRHFTQEQVARKTGVATNTIYYLETGQHEPSPETLKRLRRVFPELLRPSEFAAQTPPIVAENDDAEASASHEIPPAAPTPSDEPDPAAQRLQQDNARLVAENARLMAEQARLDDLAYRDELTNLANLRAFTARRLEEVARARRAQSHLSYIRIDLDHFKQINDIFGHPVGDQVLTQVGGILSGLRKVDCAGRVGGEEFAILCFNTDVAEATILAERLRQQIEQQLTTFIATQQPVESKQLPERNVITASFGISSLDVTVNKDIADEELAKQLDFEADEAAIQAKNNGRNRVEVARRLAGEVALREASATAEVNSSSGASGQASAPVATGVAGPRAQRQWSRRGKIKAAVALAAVFGALLGIGVLSTRTLHLGMAGCQGGSTPDKPPASGGTAAAGTGCPEGKEKALVYGEERCMPKAEKVPDCKDTNEARPCCHYGQEPCP